MIHVVVTGLMLVGPCLLLFSSGCGTAEETEQTPPTPPAPVVEQQPAPKMGFETRTDTVYTQNTRARRGENPDAERQETRFMVQIGAYKDPHNASRIQALARERFDLPVIDDYYAPSSMYQVRIGFFETRDEASTFRQQMLKQYPKEYEDSWVVQLRR